MSRVLIVVKEPGKQPFVANVENELDKLQTVVGGNIEIVMTLRRETEKRAGLLLIGNKEGRLIGLPENRMRITNLLVGTVFAIGAKDEELCGVLAADVPQLLKLMEEPRMQMNEDIDGQVGM